MEKYIYVIGMVVINFLCSLITILILNRKKRAAKTNEEKQTLEDEIANVAINMFDYLRTFCNKEKIEYEFKKVKKTALKDIKKMKGGNQYEAQNYTQQSEGQSNLCDNSEQNS